ncbi:MAG: phosphotransferase family protein, partial [Candidatus Marinimicrobia bacterium]|nr:phosphotransferase family protein [Candidatus Neomarinimicrobiota bacterium]
MDKPKDIRKGEDLPIDSLKKFLSSQGFDIKGLNIKQFPSGYSNLTYFLSTNNNEYVLRRPPFGADSLKGGHDMSREYKVLSKLKAEFKKVPNVHLYTEDKSIIGAPFYIMDCVKGYIMRPNLSQENAPDADTVSKIADSLIDTLVNLHQVDIDKSGLSDFGKIEGYVSRQVSGWTKRYFHAKTHTIPEMEFVAKWLNENQPKESGKAIIHNDFKYDNAVLDMNDPTKVISV